MRVDRRSLREGHFGQQHVEGLLSRGSSHGLIATHDKQALRAFLSHRDYNLISCGMFDDAVSALALRHADALLRRNPDHRARESRDSGRVDFRKIRIFTIQSRRPAQRRWSITILTCRRMTSASGSTTRRARSSPPAIALSSPRACASATPATKRRWKTASPRWQGLRKRSAETKSPASRQGKNRQVSARCDTIKNTPF